MNDLKMDTQLQFLGPYYHVGLVVTNFEAAIRTLGPILALHWAIPQTLSIPEGELRYTFSREGPPHVEVLQGPPATIWATDGRPYLHHLGYWSADFDADCQLLESLGLELIFDGAVVGRKVAYYQTHYGFCIELVDEDRKRVTARWLESNG